MLNHHEMLEYYQYILNKVKEHFNVKEYNTYFEIGAIVIETDEILDINILNEVLIGTNWVVTEEDIYTYYILNDNVKIDAEIWNRNRNLKELL